MKKETKETKIKEIPSLVVDDLQVGEHKQMELVAHCFAGLRTINPKYLRSLLGRLADLPAKDIKQAHGIPVFKLILFYAENLQEHIKNDPKLQEYIEEARVRSQMAGMFGGPMG